ncbi:MAG: hypothetical protein AB7H86_09090 [Blastocatellales bacterium]
MYKDQINTRLPSLPFDELEEVITLVRCGDFDMRNGDRLVDNPRLIELIDIIARDASELDFPDLRMWPDGKHLTEAVFWFKSAAVIREFLAKRPLFLERIQPFDRVEIDSLLDSVSSLVMNTDLISFPEQERINKLRLLRCAIRYILSRTTETYQLNESTGKELNELIYQLDKLVKIADYVLKSDTYNSNYSLKAEILYQKGRAERARGLNFNEAEINFTECLKLARKRLEKRHGDPGDPVATKEFLHSSYLAAQTLLQLAFLAYLQGQLSYSRRMITASWFIIHNCSDRRIKAEIQYMTAAVRRAMTTDQEKLKILDKILEQADETLSELGIIRERQMAKFELILTRIYLRDFERAENAIHEMSRMVKGEGYWEFRAKTLNAICVCHRFDHGTHIQSGRDMLRMGEKYAEAAIKGFRRLEDYRFELVQAYYVAAEVSLRIFSLTGNKQARMKAEDCLDQAEKLNSSVNKHPTFGEMNNLHNRGAIALIRCQLAVEGGDFELAERLIKTWETEISPLVESNWLHGLAERLVQRIPLRRTYFEIDVNKKSNDLYSELLKAHYHLIKSHLAKTSQKVTDREICRQMGISLNTLKTNGIIPRKKPGA